MAVLERAPDLARKLARDALAQLPVADDIVEHLPAVDVLKHHIVMVLVDDHLAHAADVGVVEQLGQRGLADGADLLGMVARGLLDGGLRVGVRLARREGLCPGQDFDRELGMRNRFGQRARPERAASRRSNPGYMPARRPTRRPAQSPQAKASRRAPPPLSRSGLKPAQSRDVHSQRAAYRLRVSVSAAPTTRCHCIQRRRTQVFWKKKDAISGSIVPQIVF